MAVAKEKKKQADYLLGIPKKGNPMLNQLKEPGEYEEKNYVRNLKIVQLAKNMNRKPSNIPSFIKRNKNIRGSELFNSKFAQDVREKAETSYNINKIMESPRTMELLSQLGERKSIIDE